MRLNRRAAFVIGGFIVAGWIVFAGIALARAAGDLRAGRDEARRAATQFDTDAVLAGRELAPLRSAAARFSSAHHRLRSPLVAPLRVVPVLGRQVRAIDAMSGAAARLSDVVAASLDRGVALADAPRSSGPDRLHLLDQLGTIVGSARTTVDALGLGPSHGLIGPIADAHDELATRLSTARRSLADAAAGLTTLSDLLHGRKRYLLVGANNAEMRAGSGMWLTGGLLTGGDGHLHLGPTSSLYETAQPSTGVTIADAALEAHWAWMHPEREWRSLMPSPRMAASAAVAADIWRAAGQPAVDGVLVVDAEGLAELVAVTGPVRVGARTIAAADVARELLHDQYVHYQDPTQKERREALSDVASAAFTALDGGQWRPSDLVQHLRTAILGRHLLAWSRDATDQRGWAGLSMDGALRADSVAVSLLNRGGNKLDWFTDVQAHLVTEARGADTAVTLQIAARVHAPANEPSYVVGPYPGGSAVAGEYRGVLAVNVPSAARDVRLAGAALDGGDGPTWMVGREVTIAPGQAATMTVTFTLPGHHGAVTIEPSARVPGIAWQYGMSAWTDTARRTIRW